MAVFFILGGIGDEAYELTGEEWRVRGLYDPYITFRGVGNVRISDSDD